MKKVILSTFLILLLINIPIVSPTNDTIIQTHIIKYIFCTERPIIINMNITSSNNVSKVVIGNSTGILVDTKNIEFYQEKVNLTNITTLTHKNTTILKFDFTPTKSGFYIIPIFIKYTNNTKVINLIFDVNIKMKNKTLVKQPKYLINIDVKNNKIVDYEIVQHYDTNNTSKTNTTKVEHKTSDNDLGTIFFVFLMLLVPFVPFILFNRR